MIATALIAGSVPVVLGSWYLAPMFERRHVVSQLRTQCQRHGLLVMTYDDGPGADLTPRLLDLLAEHEARATFFATGVDAAANPVIMDRVVEEGHELACHGARHRNGWKCSPWHAVHDIHDGYDLLSPWIDHDSTFRPPYGKLTMLSRAAIALRGASLGWWTIVGGDVNDALPSPELAAERANREGGGIVLLHDFDRGEDRAQFVIQSTGHLLRLARDRGWSVVTLRELLNRKHTHAA